MEKTAAHRLVRETLENAFHEEQFAKLVVNLLNHAESAPFTYNGNYIYDAFQDSIRQVKRLGKYTDPRRRKIDILIVYLKNEAALDHARTKQRNFIARYLNGSRGNVLKDAALVAFVAPNGEDWRFSLVRMTYKFDEQGKVKEELTPARRYSFLVGKNEDSHTAQSGLLPLLLNDSTNPTLDDLENAFNVERVTREFFGKYRGLFLRLKESLDAVVAGDDNIQADFEAKNVDTGDFAKKLLGQIVFLYFLQKKGWFGVARGAEWGTGSKHFLRELFEKEHGDYENFFNDILEPLFYNTLATERSKDWSDRFHCRIPFLNGGLFDPLHNYDWVDTDILLPNDLFSNRRKTEEGDTGDGILDIFDRHNFTVKEDEPLEKEVAVDPEMLGKVFENLLAVQDRKATGTYYTPREIVHYMCQESLTNYLTTELNGNVSKEDIEKLVQYGEAAVENDRRVVSKGRETETYTYKLPEGIREHARAIDDKLASIRVCDPAVGSGAFPVGMMNEIIRTRGALTPYIEDGKRDPYRFKRQAIQHCLYGVDIDHGAVEIAKLRLWLSLVVDEEEREAIQPLPNLNYRIVRGNALLRVEKTIFNHGLFDKLEKIKSLYFDETRPSKKQECRNQIDELIGQITNGRKEFDFEVYFSEVFHEKKGFDVVIANPPYINIENLAASLKEYIFEHYRTCSGRTDIYVAFIEKTMDHIRDNGIMTYIVPYSFTNQKYGAQLRRLLISSHYVKEILDTSEYLVFDKAVVRNILLQVVKTPQDSKTTVKHAKSAQDFRTQNFDSFLIRQQEFLKLKDHRFETKNILTSITLKEKLLEDSLVVDDICFVAYGARLNSKQKKDIGKESYIFKDFKRGLRPYHEGKNVERYRLHQSGWLKYVPREHYNPMFPALFENEKIVSINVVKDRLRFAWDQKRLWNSHTVINLVKWDLLERVKHVSVKRNKTPQKIKLGKSYDYRFLLGILNSKLLNWYFVNFLSEKLHFYPEDAKSLPIKKCVESDQRQIISLVDTILSLTQSADYLQTPAKQAQVRDYEKQIDQLVYQLYDLTDEEIAIVERAAARSSSAETTETVPPGQTQGQA